MAQEEGSCYTIQEGDGSEDCPWTGNELKFADLLIAWKRQKEAAPRLRIYNQDPKSDPYFNLSH